MDSFARITAIDELHNGLRALRALRDLLGEATAFEKDAYEIVSPDSLFELVCMVDDRLHKAVRKMEFSLSI